MKPVRVQFKKQRELSIGGITGRHADRMEIYLQARWIETADVEKAFKDVLRQYRRELAKVEARYKARARRSIAEREADLARLDGASFNGVE